MSFTSAPGDFTVGNSSITFTADNFEAPHCFEVIVNDDSTLEDTERFTLSLLTEDQDVDFKNSELVVEIVDNDSKLLYTEKKQLVFFVCLSLLWSSKNCQIPHCSNELICSVPSFHVGEWSGTSKLYTYYEHVRPKIKN